MHKTGLRPRSRFYLVCSKAGRSAMRATLLFAFRLDFIEAFP